METALLGLRKGSFHDLRRDSFDFDVELESGDACGVSGDFKIHVAECVLFAEDIGEDGEMITLEDEAHGDSGDRMANWDTRIHKSKTATAH